MAPLASLVVLTSAFLGVAVLERTRHRFVPTPLRRPYLLTDALWYGVATGPAVLFSVRFQPHLARLSIPGFGAGFAAFLSSPWSWWRSSCTTPWRSRCTASSTARTR